MDEIDIDGKIYLSSKEAAKRTGYAKDYVGQLCREGRVEARLVGRSWYVDESSIMKHRFSEEDTKSKEVAVQESVQPEESHERPDEIISESENTSNKAAWTTPVYTAEEVQSIDIPPAYRDDQHVSAMQETWKQWFESGKEKREVEPEEATVVEEETPVSESPSDVSVPLTIVHAPEPEPAYIPQLIERVVPIERIPEPQIVQRRAYIEPEKRSFIVLKSAVAAIILLVISLTLVATGVLTPSAGTAGYGLLDLVSGETKI